MAERQDPDGAADNAFVRIRNLTKSFGGFTAVDDVSLDIARGELFCLLGGSGSGKSTLLRMLAGFERPTSGSIEIDGTDMSRVEPYARPVNMMFQSYALFPHMNVRQNLAFGLRMDRVGRAEIRRRVAEMLELVKLGPFGDRKPHELSGGQRQRVALARALVKQPKLLLLDEPLGALDKKLREETQVEIMRIQKELGITFVVVTHDQEEAMTLATRIGVMNYGEIVQIGDPYDVYEYPNSRFVADFIGTANMFLGHLVEDEADYAVIDCPASGCSFYVDHGITAAPDQDLAVAVRPEKIRLAKPGTEMPEHAPHNQVPGRIAEVAYMGSHSVYHVAIAGDRRLTVKRPNENRRGDDQFDTGEEVLVLWDAYAPVVLTS
ncbi:ABC transporter ATP-binding protein [Marinibaculum pumilum]|uniref:Spermidine/putrescine import ATP-binding protein PotA n=1 Tax=Marinibaculum pumilum TaxID=1766165 RepID=A0ABV7L276_9PROT